MKQLTQKEEEIMERMWDHGPMLVRELQACYDDPRPHVNTLATLMKILEEKGFLGHKAITARCFQYFARISREEYRGGSLTNVVLSAVSALVKSEKVSVEELKELIREVEQNNQQ